MLKHIRRVGMIAGILGSATLWFSTNSIPETIKEADGFIGTNLKYIGWDNPPEALASGAVDNFVVLLSILLIVFGFLALISYVYDWAIQRKISNLSSHTSLKGNKRKSWVEKAQELPPPPAPGTILDIMAKQAAGEADTAGVNQSPQTHGPQSPAIAVAGDYHNHAAPSQFGANNTKSAIEIDEVNDIEAHRNVIGDTGGRQIIKMGKVGKARFIDNRIGNFNTGVINGDQVYNEAPSPRTPPDFESAFEETGTENFRVQVRVYGMEHEMKTFGGFIIIRLRSIGVQTGDFGDDAGTEHFAGVIVKSFYSARSKLTAEKIRDSFVRAGIKASHEHSPQEASKGHDFIRIGVGANA